MAQALKQQIQEYEQYRYRITAKLARMMEQEFPLQADWRAEARAIQEKFQERGVMNPYAPDLSLDSPEIFFDQLLVHNWDFQDHLIAKEAYWENYLIDPNVNPPENLSEAINALTPSELS